MRKKSLGTLGVVVMFAAGLGWLGVERGVPRVGSTSAFAAASGSDDKKADDKTEEADERAEKCKELLEKKAKECPQHVHQCAEIDEKIAKYSCAPKCPCDFAAGGTWYYYPTFNGVYCAPATVNGNAGRLSVCSPAGADICVLNYGSPSAITLDPATCAACRAAFPVTAPNVFSSGTVTVTSCSNIK